MAQKKTTSKKSAKSSSSSAAAPRRPSRLRSDRELARDKEILGIIICTCAAIMLISFLMAPQPDAADVNALGLVSLFIVRLLRLIGGGGAVALPIVLLLYGLLTIADKNTYGQPRLIGLLLVILAFLGLRQLPQDLTPFKDYITVAAAGTGGGAVGALLDFVLLKTLGHAGTVAVFAAMMLIGALLALQTSTREIVAAAGRFISGLRKLLGVRHTAAPVPQESGESPAQPEPRLRERLFANRESGEKAGSGTEPKETSRSVPIYAHDAAAPVITEVKEQPKKSAPRKTQFARDYMPDVTLNPEEKTGDAPAPAGRISLTQTASRTEPVLREPASRKDRPLPEPEPESEPEPEIMPEPDDKPESGLPETDAEIQPETGPASIAAPTDQTPSQPVTRPARRVRPLPETAPPFVVPAAAGTGYQLPPIELIEPGLKVRNPRMNKAITDNIGVLESTLESFGVRATVTQVVAGPAVTRYELQPAPGVKVSRITSLSDDIALSLAAPGVRIEAPIPGKSAIGIEVARKETDTVYFREMIESDEFQNAKPKLSFALGKNIGGECIVGNLVKMPHLLIAGATGSGKSICINTIICSLLYKATPDQVKLMLIDPKKVEMTQYATLPHLIAPVVNDSKKASNALKWVVNEMENRYTLFVGASCKDFEGYNRICPETPMPHIVVIIDELADLMMVAKHDVEDSICRLAQMARAAGIHLVVATQRPSVDVITGLIKANIPSRIAFAVSSYTDSRTILDMGGAEKLLGKGDMLYAPIGLNKPMRVQGTFISEEDVARLVDYCCQQASPQFSDGAVAAAVHGEKVGEGAAAGDADEDEDELLYDAAMLIATTGQASVSFLQRRLAIGNPRAARIMDTLELKGVVGPSKGAKPRDLLLTPPEIEELLG